MTLNPNPRPISLTDASLVGYRPIRNTLSYFKAFSRFDGSFLEVIGGQESECEGFCFNQLQLIRIRTNEKLDYFSRLKGSSN